VERITFLLQTFISEKAKEEIDCRKTKSNGTGISGNAFFDCLSQEKGVSLWTIVCLQQSLGALAPDKPPYFHRFASARRNIHAKQHA
jgi:hypothetical protein